MPEVSGAALALLRLHLERHGQVDVDDTNRETYRELERAGLMAVGHSFAGGRESVYRLTGEGFKRKAELLGGANGAGALTLPSPGTAAAPDR